MDVTNRRAVERLSVPQVFTNTPLHRYAKVTAACCWLLLLAGGLVTSTGSSLAVPDWPLAFGKVFPKMEGGVLFEHGHRMIAGVVAALVWVLAVWLHLKEKRTWVKAVGWACAGLILVQAVLGGLTVIFRLPPYISISHACLAQALFCGVVLCAQATSQWFQAAPPSGAAELWKMGALACAAVYIQLMLGATVRHLGQALWVHAAWALVVAHTVLRIGSKGVRVLPAEYGLLGPSLLLCLLLPLQILLGYLSYKVRFSPDLLPGFSRGALTTSTHLIVGATILGTCVVWTARARRCL